ncbi:hypothetical protein VB735_15635 [Halotia wernerae UHCC 0503]|nr:hypothetical protein [Halotia wernerae UHCC 0503]
MAFGIQDLEKDVQKFQQDIENAKAKYLDEYAEYLNITTDLENIAQKYDFLQEEVETIARVFPEKREERDNTLSGVTIAFLSSTIAVEVVAGIIYGVAQYKLWKLARHPATVEVVERLAQAGMRGGTRIRASLATANLEVLARTARAEKAAKIAKFTVGVGAILGIVSIALIIRDVRQRKEYLEEQKAELKQHLDDVNSYIAEANDDTKNVITAFSTYFNELGIDVDGVFNDNKDGFLDESGQQKFDDPENGAVSQLREALNGAIKRMGELNGATKLANRRLDRYLSQGHQGKEMIEEVVFDTELPKEVIQRLYVFKLREVGSIVQEAIELSELPEDLVKKLYARGYLDDGKTVKETVELSGLTEDQVRRVYASKLLDDRLNSENPDDVLDVKGIAERAGLSEEIVLEIQLRKIADLPSDSEEEELEPELLTR